MVGGSAVSLEITRQSFTQTITSPVFVSKNKFVVLATTRLLQQKPLNYYTTASLSNIKADSKLSDCKQRTDKLKLPQPQVVLTSVSSWTSGGDSSNYIPETQVNFVNVVKVFFYLLIFKTVNSSLF